MKSPFGRRLSLAFRAFEFRIGFNVRSGFNLFSAAREKKNKINTENA